LAAIWLVDGNPRGSPRHSPSTRPEAAIVELAQKTQIFLIVASLSDWFAYEAEDMLVIRRLQYHPGPASWSMESIRMP